LGSEGLAPRILDLSTGWRLLNSFTFRPFYPKGKSPSYPLARRLGRFQSQSGLGGEEKNSQPPPEFEPPVTQSSTAELSPFYPFLSNFYKNNSRSSGL